MQYKSNSTYGHMAEGMVMDEAFIWVSVISGLFGILGLELLTHNWFRKERFKVETYNLKKQNELQLRKMARDMGLDTKKGVSPPLETPFSSNSQGLLGQLAPFAPLLKNLDGEQISALIDRFIPQAEEEEVGSGGGIGDMLGEFVQNNPEIVQSFLGGLKSGTQKQGGNNSQV
jgi:hypothetical protein